MNHLKHIGLIIIIAIFSSRLSPTLAQDESLRIAAENQGILIGSSVNFDPLNQNPQYRSLLTDEFNLLTTENAFKFDNIHPEIDRFDFQYTDYLVQFAQDHQMKVRGHVLLWEPENPEWLTSGNFNSEQMQEILRVHIQTIVSRYSGKVWAWDIANVVLDGNSGLADNIWLRTIGPDYLDLAFQYAHEADPNALLFLNEGNRPAGTAMDPIIIYLQDMINRGVPIDGVGLSMHVDINQSNTSVSDLALNMSRLNSLGLLVTVSEVDVQIHPTTAYPTPEELNLQAHIYRDIVESCLTAPNCPSITIWGLADSYSNLLVVENIDDAPLLFDVNFQPKPAYYAVLEALQANP